MSSGVSRVEIQKLDSELKHLREIMDLRFKSLEEAIVIAKARVDEKLEGMNELRDQITQERGLYLTRDRFEAEHQTLEARISAVELQNSRWSGSIWMLGGVVSAIVVGINVLLKLWLK